MLSIVILIVIFAILIVMTLVGYRKGFLRMIFRLISLILGFVLAYFLSGPVTTTLDSMTGVRQSVQTATQAELYKITEQKYAESDEEQKEAISDSFVPEALINSYETTDNFVAEIKNDYVTNFSNYIGGLAVKLLGLIITVILTFIILSVVCYLIGFIGRLPLIGGANNIVGAIIGFVFGILIVSLVFFLITILSSTAMGRECLTAIKENAVLNFLYNGAFSIANMLL